MDSEQKKEVLTEQERLAITELLDAARTQIPKSTNPICNQCSRRVPMSAKCSVYPDVIPKPILMKREDCPHFLKK